MCACHRGRRLTPVCFTVCAVIVRYGDRWASGPPMAAARSGNTVSIRERPVEADTREVAGHRERLTPASMRRCAVLHGVADITTQLEWNESSLALIHQ